MIKLNEIFIVETSVFPPSSDKIDPQEVMRKVPEAWKALDKKAKEEYGYEDLHMFIFDTDEKGTLWAINDHNLWWDDVKKEWNEHESNDIPHW